MTMEINNAYNSYVDNSLHISKSNEPKNVGKRNSSKPNLKDNITISDSAKEMALIARDKVSDFRAMRFASISEEIREIPAEYKCENLFKLELKALSISGGRSIFEGHSENQGTVFDQWIDENAAEYLSEDELKSLKEQIDTMVAGVDKLNAQEGYRGTSFESVFLLSASEAGLKKVNEMFIPEQLQVDFSELINEYVHFNDAARNSIMEQMTPDYMVVGIGNQDESYKYKSEIISDEQSFYKKEKAVINDFCNQVLDEKTDKDTFYNEIKEYLKHYYKNRYELKDQPNAVRQKVNTMLGKLQEMYVFSS